MSEIENFIKKLIKKSILIIPIGDRILEKPNILSRKAESADDKEVKKQALANEPVNPRKNLRKISGKKFPNYLLYMG